MLGSIQVSIVAQEILPPGVPITVVSQEPFDARSAQAAITLAGERITVDLGEGGRVATVGGTDGVAPGPHVLVIDQPLSQAGERLADRIEIPFLVSDTVAQIPRELRVESMVRIDPDESAPRRIPLHRRPRSRFIEVLKATHRETAEPVELAFDQDGSPVDAAETLTTNARDRRERYGKLQPELLDRIERGPEELISVAIWIRAEQGAELPEKSDRGATREPPEAEVDQIARGRRATRRLADVIREEFGAERAEPDPVAPVVFATMPARRIRTAAEREEVSVIVLHAIDEILDLGNSIAIADSDDVHSLGFDGSGINVAVWETGPDQTNLLPITATFDPAFNGNSAHARHTHGIVANTEQHRPHGHAPACNLHSANRSSIDALRWAAIDRGCTVISQSFHRSTEPGSGNLQSDDFYKDWLALHWPYPTIVQAAGNYWATDPDRITPPESEFVNHKTYNCLVVGNHDDSAASMSGDSVFRNPTSSHNDRELPDISANGTSVTAVGLTMSGTSMATPATAGCVALIQEVNATLQSWPEGCRAIMMAGATRNPSGGTWWVDVSQGNDASDGAGAANALESVRIAQLRRFRDAAGTSRGWDVGTLRSADIGTGSETTFSYNLSVSSVLPGARAKVALAWDSAVAEPPAGQQPTASTLTVDLDLKVYDSQGMLVGYSGSYDNSYEIAEFAVTSGASYTIKIRRWSGTDDVWYGIAWR
jgi:subtilisin family serine protease